MGSCCSNLNQRSFKQVDQYWEEPVGTERMAGISLEKWLFQGTLANFKIINCEYQEISIKVQIKGVDTFMLKKKRIKRDKSLNWTFQHKFYFQMTEYQLRKTFVQVTIKDQHDLTIGDTRFNLYLISTGPYHQNFQMKLKKGSNTRIYFDLKICQSIEIQLSSIEAEIDLFKKHPGEKFNFYIKTIVGHYAPLIMSEPSYMVKVKLDNKQMQQPDGQMDNHSLLSVKKRKSILPYQVLIPEGQNLVWKKIGSLPMPSVVMKTLVSQLHHCYFQLVFEKVFEKTSSVGTQITSELFGQCFVALHKIFDIQSIDVECEGRTRQKRQFSSQDKLWNNGQQIGKGTFKFEVKSDKYIKQMQVMVRTQQGIMRHTPVYFSKRHRDKQSSTCRQLQELIEISQRIQQTTIQIDRIQTDKSDHPNVKIRKLKIDVEELLQRLLTLLQKSVQTNMVIYGYISSEEMMRAQQLFLSFGFKTIGYLQEQDPHINDLCWKILIALIGRSEFILSNIGFNDKQKGLIEKNNIDRKLQQKIDIALTYHQFLTKYLKIAVDTLSVKGLQLERDFSSLFCAYAYFRIQNFRTTIIQAFTRQSDPELPEWRGIQFSLQDDIDYDELKVSVNTFTALFDWSNSFHKVLQNFEKYQIATCQIEEVLMREDWKNRLSKRGITFFQFIKCWVEYVQSIVIKSKDIQWRYFPGYNKLLKCFLCEMKKRNILDYPDILRQSLLKLLSNEKLLNPIVMILFKKANIYEPLTVIRAISLLSDIFLMFSRKDKKMPATFNYYNFYQGIQRIMESQFSFAISKTIIILYNYYSLFGVSFRRNISMFLLGKVFFKLFLHWSFNVRHVFYHLIMRLYHESLKIDKKNHEPKGYQQQVNQEIRARYLKLFEILEQAINKKKEHQRIQYFKNIEKDFYKRLKRNIENKKRKKAKLRKQGDNNQEMSTWRCPDSPASNKFPNLNQMFESKFLLEQSNEKIPRSQSQILKPSMNILYRLNGVEKEQQVQIKNNKRNIEDFKNRIYDHTQGNKKENKFFTQDQFGIYSQSDFDIPEIEIELLEYIEKAMDQFTKTKQLFTKNFNNNSWELPKIHMQMPIDSRQIRPDKIDSW